MKIAHASKKFPEIVIVGSGLFGLTLAERIANVLDRQVLVLEKRDHIGGNIWSEFDYKTGIEGHKYGSHLFHTSNQEVWKYVNQFTQFSNYRHQVWTKHADRFYSLPINLATISQFFGKALTPKEAREIVTREIGVYKVDGPPSFESTAIKTIGSSLYNAFIKGYTEKQWQTDPKLLPPEIFTRLPFRFDFNPHYFSDKYEGLPVDGYQKFISNLIDNKNIKIEIAVNQLDFKNYIGPAKLIIYTGPLDQFFDFKFGLLGWRTLDFEVQRLEIDDFQGAPVINYADLSAPFTRIHEFQHLHPERTKKHASTIIMREFSRVSHENDEPYYPINSAHDRITLASYRNLASGCKDVIFGGRLGTYKYLDMHMAIASALTTFENKVFPRFSSN
jgi:UDP-galactopyranose mutase